MKGIFKSPSRTLTSSLVITILNVFLTFSVWGSDWAQYRGNAGDGVSSDGIEKQWTLEMVNPLWRVQFTNGLSSFSVAGGRAYTQVKRKIGTLNKEVCLALNAGTGQELWATPVDNATYPGGGVGTDDGPRSTPVISGDSVFVLSSYIKLFRLNATNGSVLWQKDLVTLYGGRVIEWQNAASPVIDNGLIYVNAGSVNNSILAMQISDGSLAWRVEN